MNIIVKLFLILLLLFNPVDVSAALRFTLFNAVTTNGTSAPVDIENTEQKTFHIIIAAGSATVAVEISVDGVVFINLVVPVTTTSVIFSNVAASYVRSVITNCTGCNVTVKAVAERN